MSTLLLDRETVIDDQLRLELDCGEPRRPAPSDEPRSVRAIRRSQQVGPARPFDEELRHDFVDPL
jgi:hypothetical protein